LTIEGMVLPIANKEALVKSPPGRHSREGGSPEYFGKTGFPASRE
jgi:hypothetical protein